MRENVKAGSQRLNAQSAGLQQKRSVPGTVFGMLCRFALALCGALGVCLMLEDAFGFIGGRYLPVVAVAVTVFCASAFLLYLSANVHRAFLIALSVFYGAVFIFAAFVATSPKGFFVGAPLSVWNHMIGKLVSIGYTSLSAFSVRTGSVPTGGSLTTVGFFTLCALISYIFTACTFRRVRAVPIIVIAGTVMTVTFTYNILESNLGFLLTVACGFGVLVLKYLSAFSPEDKEKITDKAYAYETKRKRIASASRAGIAAFTAAAIVLGIGIYPALKISEPAPELSIFGDVMDWARQKVYGVIVGPDGPVASDPDAHQKGMQPTERRSSGRRMLTVKAPSRTQLYLRSWVGEDYYDESWNEAAELPIGSYGTFIPEDVTELFYTMVDISANMLTSSDAADRTQEPRGFIKEAVTIKSIAVKSAKGFLPVRFANRYGVTEPDTLYMDYSKGYALTPGVGTVKLRMSGAEYSSVAYAPNYKNISLYRLDNDMMIFQTVYPYVESYVRLRLGMIGLSELYYSRGQRAADSAEQYIEYAAKEAADDLGNVGIKMPAGCILNRLGSMSIDEIAALNAKMDNVREYEAAVYGGGYTYIPWIDEGSVRQHAEEAYPEFAENKYNDLNGSVNPSYVYRAADSIARYLAKNYRYTVAPSGYTGDRAYVSQFLDTAKNGYCVQFATAGAMMLRALGIPARYVDGYVATSFIPDDGYGYVSNVTDAEAHAWVEAYIPYYGWMTFEMTAPMMSAIYSETPPEVIPETDPEDTTSPDDVPENTTDETTAPPETVPAVTETETEPHVSPHGPGPGKTVVAAVVTVLALAVVCTAVYAYLRYTEKRKQKRLSLFRRAAAGESDDPVKDTEFISEYITYMLGLAGIRRGRTELMSEFTERMNKKTYGKADFTKAAEAIQKYAFGHEADAEGCAALGEYALFLRGFVTDRLGRVKRFIYVKLRKLI